MVLHIPTTWFEDLGKAKRISRFRLGGPSPDLSEPEMNHYTIECDIVLQDGTRKTEQYHGMSSFPHRDRHLTAYLMRECLKNQIRGKYGD